MLVYTHIEVEESPDSEDAGKFFYLKSSSLRSYLPILHRN